MSEQEQIQKAQAGDLAAYELLIAAYESKILNYCYRMLGNRADAEDAAQEVFVKVFRFIKSFNGESSFSTWLYRIASNVCMDIVRKAKRRQQETMSLHQQNSEGEEFYLSLSDDGPSPYEKAQLREARKALEKALLDLPEEHRQVIILRDVEGRSYEEIADVLHLAPGTVKSRINRARKALQKLLEPDRELFLL
ncbi:MAG: sigma-70 family RNA polymerase sigma factor [Ruminococcaceae bacterium]|nr:sigma-70 family RNA polymerase sigma factor [Oscillospiraceae bacterium]